MLKVLEQLGRWMVSEGVEVGKLDRTAIEAFLASLRASGHPRVPSARARSLETYLRDVGVMAAEDDAVGAKGRKADAGTLRGRSCPTPKRKRRLTIVWAGSAWCWRLINTRRPAQAVLPAFAPIARAFEMWESRWTSPVRWVAFHRQRSETVERRLFRDDPAVRRVPGAPSMTEAVLELQRSAGNRALSGRLVQRAVPSVAGPNEHKLAKGMHARDRSSLAQAVSAAAEHTDERLRNSAQWIQAGKALLYALTPTADSAARAKTAGQGDKRAYFGYADKDPFHTSPVAGHVLDAAVVADYNTEDMEDNARVLFDSPDSGGFRTPAGQKIFVMEPSRIDAANALRKELGKPGMLPSVAETLKHETQHEADVLYNVDYFTAEVERALEEYRTEFRAYTAQGADWLTDPPDPRTVDKIGLSFPDPVQFQVFHQIYQGYPRVKNAWDNDLKLRDGTPFRTAVLKMRGGIERISANPYNSPRVHEFWELVGKVSRDQSEEPQTEELVALLRNFDASDRRVVQRGSVYRGLELGRWVREVIDLLLKDPTADVADVLAAERQRRQQEGEARRAEQRKRPPTKADLCEAFGSWEQVRTCLTDVKVNGNPALEDEEVKEELEEWSKWTDKDFAEGLEAFVGNLHSKIDWWAIVDSRRQ